MHYAILNLKSTCSQINIYWNDKISEKSEKIDEAVSHFCDFNISIFQIVGKSEKKEFVELSYRVHREKMWNHFF